MITSPELKETEAALTAKRKSLHDVYAEAGTELDMTKVKSLDGDSAAKVEAIRAMDAEINDLSVKAEGLRDLLRIAETVKADEADERGTAGDAAGTAGPSTKSIGELFSESKARTTKNLQVDFDVELKTLLDTSTGWAPETTRGPRLVDFATRPLQVVDLFPQTTTDQTAVTYMEETTYTNAAAETAEGALKPEAALALTEKSSAVRKIAVLLPVTDEQLEDVPRLRGYLDNRLPFMVRQRLDSQLLVGNGTAPNLRGLLNVVGIQTQAKATDPTPDAVYKAMVKVMVTGQAMPDAYVTNPLDWQDVRLLRTADGIYIWGNPSEAGPERIWGLRVALAQALTENTGIVGDFQNFSELAVKKGITMDSGYVADDFAKNRQTLRAEMRAAAVFYRPTAFCSVTGI